MEITQVSLPVIAIIGKQGFCTKNYNLTQELWNDANVHFAEVAALGMKEKDGSFVGFWGAMSDESMSFLPWTNEFTTGYYLAGIEVYPDTPVPEGWTMWILPARTYLKILVNPGNYNSVFHSMIEKTIPEMKLRLTGAVCDYIEPSTGRNFMLFPITSDQ